MRQSAASAVDRLGLLALLIIVALAAGAGVAGPERLTTVLLLGIGALVVAARPQWGVASILFLLMVQYGSRRYEREGVAGELASLLPQGSGLLTINNMLGLFLGLLMIYHLQRGRDWSFLRSRQVQLMFAITLVLVFSAWISGIDAADQLEAGLVATTAADPSRVLVSRALFLVLLVFFLPEPRDLRLIVGLFVSLALLTAWSGSAAAITGTGQLGMSAYRAGGLEVLIQSSKNPNRLALIATLALVFVWEYGQAYQSRRWVRGSALAIALLMVVTVFLSASRGGLIGLVAAGMMLFVRRRGGSGRFLYGLAAIVIGILLVRELVPEQVVERITNIPGISRSDPGATSAGGGSVERRRYTYEIGLQIWRTAPIVGVGPGNWPYMRFLLDPLHSVGVAHNSYLAALAEGGLISLVLYLTLFYVTVRDLLRCERDPESVQRAQRDGLHWLLPATRICLMAFLVFSLFGDLWDLIFAYFLLGVAAVLIIRYQPAPARYPVRRVVYA